MRWCLKLARIASLEKAPSEKEDLRSGALFEFEGNPRNPPEVKLQLFRKKCTSTHSFGWTKE